MELTKPWLHDVFRKSAFNITEIECLSLEKQNISGLSNAFEGLTKTVQVNLARNKLENLDGIEHLENLQILVLFKNCIVDWKEIEKLKELKALKKLDLRLNPITAHRNYRYRMVQLLPNLTRLDDHVVTKSEREAPLNADDSESDTSDDSVFGEIKHIIDLKNKEAGSTGNIDDIDDLNMSSISSIQSPFKHLQVSSRTSPSLKENKVLKTNLNSTVPSIISNSGSGSGSPIVINDDSKAVSNDKQEQKDMNSSSLPNTVVDELKQSFNSALKRAEALMSGNFGSYKNPSSPTQPSQELGSSTSSLPSHLEGKSIKPIQHVMTPPSMLLGHQNQNSNNDRMEYHSPLHNQQQQQHLSTERPLSATDLAISSANLSSSMAQTNRNFLMENSQVATTTTTRAHSVHVPSVQQQEQPQLHQNFSSLNNNQYVHSHPQENYHQQQQHVSSPNNASSGYQQVNRQQPQQPQQQQQQNFSPNNTSSSFQYVQNWNPNTGTSPQSNSAQQQFQDSSNMNMHNNGRNTYDFGGSLASLNRNSPSRQEFEATSTLGSSHVHHSELKETPTRARFRQSLLVTPQERNSPGVMPTSRSDVAESVINRLSGEGPLTTMISSPSLSSNRQPSPAKSSPLPHTSIPRKASPLASSSNLPIHQDSTKNEESEKMIEELSSKDIHSIVKQALTEQNSGNSSQQILIKLLLEAHEKEVQSLKDQLEKADNEVSEIKENHLKTQSINEDALEALKTTQDTLIKTNTVLRDSLQEEKKRHEAEKEHWMANFERLKNIKASNESYICDKCGSSQLE